MCHVIIQQSHQSRRKLSFFCIRVQIHRVCQLWNNSVNCSVADWSISSPQTKRRKKNKPCVYILNLTNTNQYYTVCFGCIKDSYIPDQTDTLPSLSICNFLSTKNFKAKKFHKVSSCKNGISNLKYGKAILGKIFGNIFFKFLFGE